MKSMKNNKIPGKDGLTKEFYETFWCELTTPLMKSVNQAFHTKTLSISQRQAVIKLIEKKDRDERYIINNWIPIDTKFLSKAISNKVKTVLPTLISSQQTTYVKTRFTGEDDRLISDITEISNWLNITGFLVAMYIEKAFDSLDHSFIISVLKKFGF